MIVNDDGKSLNAKQYSIKRDVNSPDGNEFYHLGWKESDRMEHGIHVQIGVVVVVERLLVEAGYVQVEE